MGDTLPISRSLTLITSANSLLSCKITYLQVLRLRTWTSLEGYSSAYHACIYYLQSFLVKKMNLKLFLITLYIDSSFLPVSSPTFLYVLANEFPTISSKHRFYSYLIAAMKLKDAYSLEGKL